MFVVHILHIVLQASEKQMLRIDALLNITAMKHAHALWNVANEKLISHTMGFFYVALNTQVSIPIATSTALPEMATALINLYFF